MLPANDARSAGRLFLVPDPDRPSGPSPPTRSTLSPCDSCRDRAVCRRPCAALEALIPPEHRPSYKEVGSEALMRGYLAAGAVPPHTSDEPAELEAAPAPRPERQQLWRALARLPAAHRYVVVARHDGGSSAQVARRCRTSSQVVNTLVRQSLAWLTDEIRAATHAANDNQHRYEEDPMTRDSTKETETVNGVPCAEPGCPNLVSTRPAANPQLAPYCGYHRRQYAKDDQSQLPIGERLPVGVPPIPTIEEREAIDRLTARAASGTVEMVQMTPGMALALLERNQQNRPVARSRVEVYARDMVAGAWQVNNQGIALGADGRLFDGQHRLLAVVRARRTVPMLVVSGLPDTVRGTIDQGRLRSLGDNLRILDGETDGTRLVSWFKSIEQLTTGKPKPLSHAIIRRQLQRYESSVRWFLTNGPRTRPFYRATLVGALVYAHRVAAKEVEHFTRRYVTGADLPAGCAVLTLRDYVVGGCGEPPRVVAIKTLRCLLADMRGERIDKLHAKDDVLDHFRALHQALDTTVAVAA